MLIPKMMNLSRPGRQGRQCSDRGHFASQRRIRIMNRASSRSTMNGYDRCQGSSSTACGGPMARRCLI